MNPRFWAKTGQGEFQDNGQPKYHPVICHLADTAAVAKEIVSNYLSPITRKTLEIGLGLSAESTIKCCAFFAGTHDLGKVSPAFQFQVSKVGEILAGGELYDLWHSIPTGNKNSKTPHGTVTARTLPEFLIGMGMDEKIAKKLAAIVGGHHGFFPSSKEIRNLDRDLAGLRHWQKHSSDIFTQLVEFVELTPADLPLQCDNAALMILAGLTTVSDWIASNSDYFPYANDRAFAEYALELQEKAKNALQIIGWTKLTTGKPIDFTELFDIKEPRELQKQAIALAAHLTAPCLMLVEASMGEGKTETALYLADYLQQTAGTGGFYIGLPTQATSNAMFERVKKFLGHRYPKSEFPDLINLTLSHAAAALKEDYLQSICRLDGEREVYDEDEDSQVVAREWHTARKRTMLSPYGVGTLDQALMGIVRSKHQFVRLFGLAGRTVILDEIHAYDLYTGTLLERFLEWLALLGSPVIALSATLPLNTRRRLINAYARGCNDLETKLELPIAEYPRLTTFSQERVSVDHFPASSHVTRTLKLEWIKDENLESQLVNALSDGGCAAIVCSTVDRAQTIFQRLQGHFQPEELKLFHGRFLFKNREEIEKDCLEKFGQPEDNPHRPKRFVLVATQVIEQSLDLDFDLMISDLAPIDLLLQRSGRLHRHPNRKYRPQNLTAPTMWLIEPEIDDRGSPDFGSSKYIYDRHILLRTWLKIRSLQQLDLPAMMDDLIESVYNSDLIPPEDLTPVLIEDWQNSGANSKRENETLQARARQVHIPPAREKEKPDQFTRKGDEDDDNTIATVTRMGEESIATIFLQQSATGLVLAGSEHQIDLKVPPDLDTIRSLLSHSTRISKPELVKELKQQKKVSTWTSALLKYACYVKLNANGEVTIGKWQIRLDPQLGVVIKSE